MKKDFDRWNEAKKKRDKGTLLGGPFPKEGMVWMCILGVNIGFEQNGAEKDFERPVLVVKKFNNQMYWAVPLSSKQKGYDFYFNFTDPNGLEAAAVLAQMRLISIKRFVREMYRFDDTLFAKVIADIVGFLDKSKPRTGRGFSGPSETEGTVKRGYTNRSKKSMHMAGVVENGNPPFSGSPRRPKPLIPKAYMNTSKKSINARKVVDKTKTPIKP